MLGILLVVFAFFLALVLISLGWFWGGYNTLQRGKQNVLTMFSNIKTEYQRRADLFYNLAESVKGNAKFEKDTLKQVIEMRGGNFGKDNKTALKNMKELDSFFNRLMVVFERYPDLKSHESYRELMKEIRITEDRVNIVRTEYNDTVREYNLYILSFPSNILAGMFNFKEEEYFNNEEGTDNAPKIDLKI